MLRPVQLMQIVFSLEVGGLENLVLNLTEKLNRSKYNIAICSLSPVGKLEKRFKQIGVPVYNLIKRKGIDYSLYSRLSELFQKKQIDIIHTHNSAPWFYAALPAKLAGVKVIVHTEHSNVFSGRKMMVFAEKLLSHITDVVISDSEKVTNHLVAKQGMDKRKIQTIVNGIDFNRFGVKIDVNAKKRELGVSEQGFIIGNVARLELVKDHMFMLKIFKLIVNDIPNAILIIVGDGSQKENLKKRVIELEIQNNVIFLGTRSDIPDIIKIFDVFVLSSISEGLSLSILEAMASGIPVVATNVGGNPEVVIDGETGFLCPLNEPEIMAEDIICILKNKDLSHRMGEAGLKRVKEHFSLVRMVEMYENVYDKCLRNKGYTIDI